MKPAAKGFLILVAAVLLNGATYHFTKAAIRASSPATTVAVTSVFVAALFLAGGFLWRSLRFPGGQIAAMTPRLLGQVIEMRWRALISAGLVGGAGGWLISITNKLYGPETAAFLGNLTFLFLIWIGLVSGERLHAGEIAAIVLILAGALGFSYTDGKVQWAALGLMSGGCLLTSVKQFLAKNVVAQENTCAAVAALNVFMALSAAVLGGCTGTLVMPNGGALWYSFLAALCGGCAGMSLLYNGYILVGVSRGAPVDAMRPLVVLLIGLATGTPFPGTVQVLGGALVLIGSGALGWTMGRMREKAAGAATNGER